MRVPTTGKSGTEHRRLLANGINLALEGKLNSTGSFTVTANQTTTQVDDPRASTVSTILFSPLTANAAAEIGTMYISTKNSGSFTVTHANNAQTDRDFDYVVIG